MNVMTYAEQARAQKAADADAMGIDDALISALVEAFYARIRDDAMLGPIFAERVQHWSPHLGRMKDFWASIAIESGRFHGNPMLKHVAIPGLTQDHFAHWLALWDATIADIVTNRDAADMLRDRARRIAKSLLTAIELYRGGLAAVCQ